MGRFDEYEEYLNKYQGIYGRDVVVLYQFGMFYELYGIDNEHQKIGNVSELANLLNITESRLNTKIPESRTNPKMTGFQCITLDRHLDVLIEHGYTVVIVDQVTPAPHVTRAVTAIWSQGTYINDIGNRDNYLVSLYIESELHRLSGRRYNHISMSAINLATGCSYIHEADSIPSDPSRAIDETYRFLQTFAPVEVLVNSRNFDDSGDVPLTERLDISHITTHLKINQVAKEIYAPAYQEHYLQRLFPDHGIISAVEYLHLHMLETARVSYILLLKFCEDHNASLLHNLREPELWTVENNLILDNNAICQLNLSDEQYRSSQTSHKKRLHSVLSVIDYTVTRMGSRLLRERVMNPIISPTELEARYRYVQYMMDKRLDLVSETSLIQVVPGQVSWWCCVEKILRGVKDIERSHRRIQLGLLTPAELVSLHDSYLAIARLLRETRDSPLDELVGSDLRERFSQFCQMYQGIIDLEEARKYSNMNDISDSFFKLGYNQEIDEISAEIKHCTRVVQLLTEKLSDMVKKGSDSIKYRPSGTDDSYFLDISKPRFKTFESSFSPLQVDFEERTYQIAKLESFVIDKRNKSNVKMTCQVVDDLHSRKHENIQRLRVVIRKVYTELLETISRDWSKFLGVLTSIVALVDVYMSCAKLAEKCNYCKPVIRSVDTREESKSYLDVTGLRHPIIEKIVKTNYVSHKVSLGQEVDGMLLYGINQTGKSSTMKAIGIAVILAQAGLYVPASQFTFYPYKKIMTRILGNDKMHGGMSSFAVEMAELRGILIRADNRTLVLGDEICHGTETKSAVSIVTASIIELAERQSSFVFATHLHQLSEMSEIESLQRVRQYHLTMTRDPATGDIIYDRQLKEGSGSDLYGIEVARALRVPFNVIERATEIRRKYFGIENRTSSYNSQVYEEYCIVCKQSDGQVKKATETHHIQFQSEADSEGFIGASSIHKDHASNLVPLCHHHHMQVHNPDSTELIIAGYMLDGKLEFYQRKPLQSLNIKKAKASCMIKNDAGHK
jgi:DNA mismatch repair protein MutS